MPFSAITDGLSNTLLAGEKHVPPVWFGKGWYDNSYYNGDYTLSTLRAAGPDFPLAQWPTDFSLSPDGQSLYMVNIGADKLLQVDATSGESFGTNSLYRCLRSLSCN